MKFITLTPPFPRFPLTALAASLLSASALAQTAAPTSTLPAVRVQAGAEESATGPVQGFTAKRSASGTKTDTPLRETPQSVSVITRDEVQARGASNIKEVIGYTPGITPSNSFDLREDLTSLRGFPYDWASMYLDGLQMPSSTYAISTMEPYGLERIEVVRGPASMLYGQTSTGGLINMVSKRPSSVPAREVKLLLGNHARRQLAFDLTGPIGDGGEWSYRLVGLTRDSKTAVEHVRGDRDFLAPSLTWRPSRQTSLTLLASTISDDLGHSGGTQAFLPASGIVLPNPNGSIAAHTNGGEPHFDFYKKKQQSVGYDLEHIFNDTFTLQQNLRVRKVDVDYQTAYGLGLDPGDPSERTLTRAAFGSFGCNESVSADTRLQARWTQGRVEHTTLVGLDLRRTRVNERNYFGDGPSLDVFAPVYGAAIALPALPYVDQTVESKQAGVYVQDQLKFDKRWVLTLGARWDEAKLDVDERSTPYVLKKTDRKATGRAGLNYLFDNGVSPYVSAATSFTPTLDPNPYGAPFEPRTGKQVEAGVKVQPVGSNSLYSAAVFELTQRNALTSDPDQVNRPFGQVQTGEFRSRGLELEAKTALTKSLSLIASYTHLDAKFTRSNSDNLGNSPKGIPDDSAALWVDYKVQQGLSLGAGARYVGERASSDSAAERFTLPAFTMLDAAVRYEFDRYELALNVNNLTDKVTHDCWGARCWYGAARSVQGSLSYRW
jgi:iron complex outermembrane receptor protein